LPASAMRKYGDCSRSAPSGSGSGRARAGTTPPSETALVVARRAAFGGILRVVRCGDFLEIREKVFTRRIRHLQAFSRDRVVISRPILVPLLGLLFELFRCLRRHVMRLPGASAGTLHLLRREG